MNTLKTTKKDKKTKQSNQILNIGQIINGQIIEVGKDSIFIDLGPYKTGILLGREMKENREIIRDIKSGDPISAMVIDPENDEGYVELSLKEAYFKKTWEALRELKDGNFPVKARVKQVNRGGLIITVKGVIGFLPVSQLSSENYPRIEDGDTSKITNELNKFLNKEFEVKIIDLDPSQEKLIVSEKLLEEKKIKEVLDQYKVGDVVEGEITGITNFGAFARIPLDNTSVDGLIHIAEMDWQLIENPKQVVRIGEKVKVKIIGIDGNRLALSLKALKQDPWKEIENKYEKGSVVKGVIVKFNPYGAFVEVEKNIHGLIHVSEFESIEAAKDKLKLNNEYEFKITFFNPNSHKMTLSLTSDKKNKKEKDSAESKEITKEDTEDTKKDEKEK